MRLNAFELRYYPPAVTVRYTRHGGVDAAADVIEVPFCVTSVQECFDFLRAQHPFLSHYRDQTAQISKTLVDAQAMGLKGKYVPRAVLTSHLLPITCCSLDKAGELLVTTSHDRTAKIYRLDPTCTGAPATELWTLEGHEHLVYTAGFSYPAARLCATASFDGSCRLWDVESGQSLTTLIDSTRIAELLCLDFSPTREELLALGASNGMIYVWDVNRPEQALMSLQAHTEEAVSISFDGKSGNKLITASFDGQVLVHDLRALPASLSNGLKEDQDSTNRSATSKSIVKHPVEITSVSTDWGMTMVASGSADGTICVTDLRAPERPLYRHCFGAEIMSCSLALSKRYTAVAIHKGDSICVPDPISRSHRQRKAKKNEVDAYVIDNDQGGLVGLLQGHVGEINTVRFTYPGFGSRIITCSDDRTVRVWNGPDDLKKPLAETLRLDGHTDAVTCLDVSYDSSIIVSAAANNVCRMYSWVPK